MYEETQKYEIPEVFESLTTLLSNTSEFVTRITEWQPITLNNLCIDAHHFPEIVVNNPRWIACPKCKGVRNENECESCEGIGVVVLTGIRGKVNRNSWVSNLIDYQSL
jgi:hypothetical protein